MFSPLGKDPSFSTDVARPEFWSFTDLIQACIPARFSHDLDPVGAPVTHLMEAKVVGPQDASEARLEVVHRLIPVRNLGGLRTHGFILTPEWRNVKTYLSLQAHSL